MKFTKLSILVIGSLIFAGCTYGNSDPKATTLPQEVGEDLPEVNVMEGDEAMMEGDEAMMEERETPYGISEDSEDDDSWMYPDKESGVPEIKMSNYTFGVVEIVASVGDELVLTITNDGGTHDFVIDELEIDTGNIPEGETMEVTIPTDKKGIFEYYCSVGKHRELGMKGTLVIK